MHTSFDPFTGESWPDQRGCTPFELALELRAGGALAATAVPRLERHLELCATCRLHAERLTRIDAALAPVRAPSDGARAEVRRRRLANGIRRARYRVHMIAVLVVVGFFGLELGVDVGFGLAPSDTFPGHLAVACAFVFGFVPTMLVFLRLRRQIAAHDVVVARRAELRRNLRGIAWALPCVFIGAVLFVARFLHDSADAQEYVWAAQRRMAGDVLTLVGAVIAIVAMVSCMMLC